MKKPQPSLKKLQNEWYAKLKQTGFQDIERNDGTNNLKRNVGELLKVEYRDALTFQSHERYYQLAAQLLHDHRFASLQEKWIWAAHAKGRTNNEIAELHKMDRRTVARIVAKVAKCIKA